MQHSQPSITVVVTAKILKSKAATMHVAQHRGTPQESKLHTPSLWRFILPNKEKIGFVSGWGGTEWDDGSLTSDKISAARTCDDVLVASNIGWQP